MSKPLSNDVVRYVTVRLLILYAAAVVVLILIALFETQAQWVWDQVLALFDLTKSWAEDAQKAKADMAALGFWGPLVFMGLQIFQVLASPVPGELVGPIGGYVFGAFWATVYSTIGLAVGSWINFFVARALGRGFVERAIPPKVLDKMDFAMEGKGMMVVFIGFLLPGFPKDYFSYFLGITAIGPRAFMVVSALARIPGTVALSLQGAMLADRDWIGLVVVTIVSLIFFIPCFWYRKQIHAWLLRLDHKDRTLKRLQDEEIAEIRADRLGPEPAGSAKIDEEKT
jgi:uncharacterized membrane protein YdjX (TVP38/TMEM64 family)